MGTLGTCHRIFFEGPQLAVVKFLKLKKILSSERSRSAGVPGAPMQVKTLLDLERNGWTMSKKIVRL